MACSHQGEFVWIAVANETGLGERSQWYRTWTISCQASQGHRALRITLAVCNQFSEIVAVSFEYSSSLMFSRRSLESGC